MIHGLSASTLRPASREARMWSILLRLPPASTTTLPGRSVHMRRSESLVVWMSSSQSVGWSARVLKPSMRLRCS